MIVSNNEYNWDKILYKKYLYHINNQLSEDNIKNIKKYINYKQYTKLYEEIKNLTNNIKDKLNNEIEKDCKV